MKKLLTCLMSVMLLFMVACFAACDKEKEIEGEVILSTEAFLSKTGYDPILSTDKCYCGEDLYLVVKVLEAQNTTSVAQSVSMEITIDNARYVAVKLGAANDADPKIYESESATDLVTRIEGISFTINANSTKKPEPYTFLLIPSLPCEGKIKVSYKNEMITEGAMYTRGYKFEKRENLNRLPSPSIFANEDRLRWTTDSELGYFVQVLDMQNQVLYSEKCPASELKLKDAFASGMIAGQYTLKVTAIGDKINVDDSLASVFYFTLTENLSIAINEQGKVVWAPVEGARGYNVTIDGSQTIFVQEASFDIAKEYVGDAKDILVEVLPIFEQTYVLCMPSNIINVTVLSAPVITVSGGKASWGAVAGATSYDIYINGVYKETITNTEYRKQIGENIMLTVVAKGGLGVVSTHSQAVDISTD